MCQNNGKLTDFFIATKFESIFHNMSITKKFASVKGMDSKDIDLMVDEIIAEATLSEKITMMAGIGFFRQIKESNYTWGADPYRAGAGCERLGVPALYFTDGPRGVVRGQSTCFPVSMARGATWDTNLERRVGEVMGIEARAQGCNLSGAVCINLLRHPAWGRAQETYGEDTFHVGIMGAALAKGIQTHNVMATVKHFVVNSIENSRFKVNVEISDRALREVYLPHFQRVIDSGCASVMSAYNKINGEYCGQNRDLLTNLLRHEMKFDGFVHSDWVMGVYHPYGASAGLDIENPEPRCFGEKLEEGILKGFIEPSVVDTACRRILRTLYKFKSSDDPLEDYPENLVACPSHINLAREVAEKSAVLLTNNGLLPLKKSVNVGVFGTLATKENTGDFGSSKVNASYVITPLQGIRNYLENEEIEVAGDENNLEDATKAASNVDVAIVVVGYTAKLEGEYIPENFGGQNAPTSDDSADSKMPVGGDRTNLGLPDEQVALINAISEANKNTIVVVVAGSAVLMSDWVDKVGAVLQTFYSGMEGGNALASLLYGERNPSGKLPFSVARYRDDYPFFDKDADEIEYGMYHGYTLFEREKIKAQFPFGHGLSYTDFSYRGLAVEPDQAGINVQVTVHNTGKTIGDEIVQIYVGFPGKIIDRPQKLLRGFKRVNLAPGDHKTVDFHISYDELKFWCPDQRDWIIERGQHQVFAGGTSDNNYLISSNFSV